MCELCLPRRQVLAGLAAAPFLLTAPLVSNPARVAPGLSIHPRSDWAGENRPARGPIDAEEVRFLLVHHTAGASSYAEADVAQLIRNIYDFHTGPEKGWPDIAYNFLIDRYGGVWEAREGSLDRAVRGDATGGNQGYSQLVSVMGDFGSQLPTDAALDSLVRTLAWLADRHGLDTDPTATTSFDSRGSNRHLAGAFVTTPVITGHRAMSQTTCPGEALFTYVADGLMADVTAARSGSTPATPSTATSTSTTSTTTPQATTRTEATDSAEAPDSTIVTTAGSSVTVSDATTGSTSDQVSASDTVDPVSSTTTTQATAPGKSEVAARSNSSSSNDALSAWQALGVAGAGVAAAAAGLLAVRRREQPTEELG